MSRYSRKRRGEIDWGWLQVERDRDPDGLQFNHVSWVVVVTIGRLQWQMSWAGEW